MFTFSTPLPRPRAVWAHFTRRCGRHMPFKRTLRARQRRAARFFVRRSCA